MTKNKKTISSFFCPATPGGKGFFCSSSLLQTTILFWAIGLLSACDSSYMPQMPTVLSGDTQSEEMADATSHMQPAAEAPRVIPAAPRQQLNPKNLFGKSLRSDDERLDRLERAVQDMRNEFNNVEPSIRRLMAIEGDIQNLIAELQELSEDPSMAKPLRPQPVAEPMPLTPKQPTKTVPKPIKTRPAPTASVEPVAIVPVTAPTAAAAPTTAPAQTFSRPDPNGNTGVYSVRVGEHPGKTRIVLDVGTKQTFRTDIDNNEKIMIVELPDAQWSAAKSQNFGKSPFISSYKVEETGDGHMMIFQLKNKAKIGYEAEIGSVNGQGRRIVIDLING